MRSNPLTQASDGVQLPSSTRIRTDIEQPPAELLRIEKSSRRGAFIYIGFGLLMAAFAVAKAVRGASSRDTTISVIVVCGVLCCALMMYGFSRLARTLRLARIPEPPAAAD